MIPLVRVGVVASWLLVVISVSVVIAPSTRYRLVVPAAILIAASLLICVVQLGNLFRRRGPGSMSCREQTKHVMNHPLVVAPAVIAFACLAIVFFRGDFGPGALEVVDGRRYGNNHGELVPMTDAEWDAAHAAYLLWATAAGAMAGSVAFILRLGAIGVDL